MCNSKGKIAILNPKCLQPLLRSRSGVRMVPGRRKAAFLFKKILKISFFDYITEDFLPPPHVVRKVEALSRIKLLYKRN